MGAKKVALSASRQNVIVAVTYPCRCPVPQTALKGNVPENSNGARNHHGGGSPGLRLRLTLVERN
jgi:hypothetical protein